MNRTEDEIFARCVALANKEYREIQDEIDMTQAITYITEECFLYSFE